ncbi:E3 ubiquitin-protein ligase ORTHRUS 2-like [Melia azedarach]|uniref:E3 ubiquitin-protein ligase ORTHRUS 2-like n=1 Tax=Melia azedarach TaxID=155640 RepID=A0ACC1YBI0_MELAZ|nr:E3 ubiquitin-protein ligase ORTHRUS 2-like [Melia azedarach]
MAKMSMSNAAGWPPKVPHDHFGPILAEDDPIRKHGVLVGESWKDRLECRQWSVHLPHAAGIAGQSDYGAQLVALSGGYVDDEDHSECGGRDLSGNKRTNKTQSFDQKFENCNEASRVSQGETFLLCPETGVQYNGIYRIEKCWHIYVCKVCRYLFVRCDNDPTPWTRDNYWDHPKPQPIIRELMNAINITEQKKPPFWDYNIVFYSWGYIQIDNTMVVTVEMQLNACGGKNLHHMVESRLMEDILNMGRESERLIS